MFRDTCLSNAAAVTASPGGTEKGTEEEEEEEEEEEASFPLLLVSAASEAAFPPTEEGSRQSEESSLRTREEEEERGGLTSISSGREGFLGEFPWNLKKNEKKNYIQDNHSLMLCFSTFCSILGQPAGEPFPSRR